MEIVLEIYSIFNLMCALIWHASYDLKGNLKLTFSLNLNKDCLKLWENLYLLLDQTFLILQLRAFHLS